MRTLLLLLMLAHPPTHSHGPPRTVWCGPMFNDEGEVDRATSECVARVLYSGRVAVVGAECPDGAKVRIPVYLSPDGEIWVPRMEKVCEGHMDDGE